MSCERYVTHTSTEETITAVMRSRARHWERYLHERCPLDHCEQHPSDFSRFEVHVLTRPPPDDAQLLSRKTHANPFFDHNLFDSADYFTDPNRNHLQPFKPLLEGRVSTERDNVDCFLLQRCSTDPRWIDLYHAAQGRCAE